MSMDFIKILGDVITEQINVQAGAVGASVGQQAASGGSSQVSSHNWVSGTKIGPVLKNPGQCKNYGQIRNRGESNEYTHNSCDVGLSVGTAVYAPYDAEFTIVDNSKCGNGIDLNGEVDGKKLYSRFCHLSSRIVPSNGKVTKGQGIGTTGGGVGEPGAGNTTGPHLHWSFKVDGVSTNPYTYN